MARTDPEWMRRIIAGLKDPGEQACAWALLASGLADRDKPAARAALTESIQIIDRLLDSTGTAERGLIRGMATNPAASILPIVERVAPERVEEVFWRAVALMPKNDAARGLRLAAPGVGLSAIFLARYDRQVAAALTTQIDQILRSPARGPRGHLEYDIWAKAAIDPRVPWRSSKRFLRAVRIRIIRRIETGSSWRPGWRNPPSALEERLALLRCRLRLTNIRFKIGLQPSKPSANLSVYNACPSSAPMA